MNVRTSTAVLLAAKLLVGLSAGFFFTYQWSVIRGLAVVGDVTYVETFQAINATIRNPWFATVFFGSIPALIAVLVFRWDAGRNVRLVAATALTLYLVGVGITFAGNVVLNDELALVTTVTEQTAAIGRADFEADWNRLNLIRTVAIIASFACLLLVARDERVARD